jgi:cytochrome c oxidase cbb3-type subunit 1
LSTAAADTTEVAELRPPRGSEPDSAATGHVLAASAFLALGAVLWLAALVAARFPALLPLSYGRWRPMAMIALLLGWLVLGLSAGIYYVLPRLTGAPLAGERLANLGLVGSVAVFGGAIVLVGLGLGDGREPFSLPWWWDLPVMAVLAVPAVVTVASLRRRRENIVYPTLWFVAAGTTWLPVLYLVTNLPGLRSLAVTLGDFVFSAGFIHVWGLGVATGLAYYVVPKASEQPLANRQLAGVGFWSLVLAGVWSGAAQTVGTALPEWLPGIAAVFALALPVAAAANAFNIAWTIGPQWRTIGDQPILAAAAGGSVLAVVAAVLTSAASFRSAGVLVGFTMFWEGVGYLMLFGAIGLLFAAFAWQAVPNLVGRAVERRRAARTVRRLLTAVPATSALLVAAGLATGYSWTGGAYTGFFVGPGAGWSEAAGPGNILVGLAILTGLVALLAELGLAASVYRALTSGRVVAQEVLVAEVGDE